MFWFSKLFGDTSPVTPVVQASAAPPSLGAPADFRQNSCGQGLRPSWSPGRQYWIFNWWAFLFSYLFATQTIFGEGQKIQHVCQEGHSGLRLLAPPFRVKSARGGLSLGAVEAFDTGCFREMFNGRAHNPVPCFFVSELLNILRCIG